MSDKPKMKLSEQASGILRDICFARMRVLKAGDIVNADALPKHTELGEFAARQSLHVFDFFRSAMAGHEEAVKRQSVVQHSMGPHAGGDYYDGIIEDYQRIMTALMRQGQSEPREGLCESTKNRPGADVVYIGLPFLS
jgi:hypothetical protein